MLISASPFRAVQSTPTFMKEQSGRVLIKVALAGVVKTSSTKGFTTSGNIQNSSQVWGYHPGHRIEKTQNEEFFNSSNAFNSNFHVKEITPKNLKSSKPEDFY
jgi:hypothetical protein